MASIFRTLTCCLVAFFLLASQPLVAQSVPSPANLRNALTGNSGEKPQEAATAENPAKEAIQQTLDLLAERDRNQEKLEALKQQLKEAPGQIESARQELKNLQAQPAVTEDAFQAKGIQQLEQQLKSHLEQLDRWQKELTTASNLVITAQTRPERAQDEISRAQSRTQQIGSKLKTADESTKPLSTEEKDQLLAEQAMLASRMQLRREELAGNNLLQELGLAQRALLETRISRLDNERRLLQNQINQLRRAASQETLEEQSRTAQKAGSDALLARESQFNVKLSDGLLMATERLNQVAASNLEVKQQLDNLTLTEQNLEEQISVLEGSLLLARILYQQKQSLPNLNTDDGSLADEIADLRLHQFDLNQQREALAKPNEYVDKVLESQPAEESSAELRKTLLSLVMTRQELVDHLSRELNDLLNESITLQLNQRELLTTATNLRKTLDKQLFWIPSNKPLDWKWLQNSPAQLGKQIESMHLGNILIDLGKGLVSELWLFTPLLLIIGLVLWYRRRLYIKLRSLHKDVGHFRRDSQLHTPLALLINLMLAVPGALFLVICAYALEVDGQGQNRLFANALYEMALAWLILYTAYRALAPRGVAELHFNWPRPTTSFLRRQVRHLAIVSLPLIVVVTMAEQRPQILADDVLGIIVLILGYLLMSWQLFELFFRGPERTHVSIVRSVLGLLFSLLPLVLIVAVVSGYYYTALKLTDRLIDTLYLVIIWAGLEASLVRWLSVAARRLAYQRLLARRREAADNDTVEEPALDMTQVSQQSLRLIHLVLLALFLVCLYVIWSELIGVFSYLDTITLYEYSRGTGDAVTLVPISLLDFLGALLIGLITIVLARNLPGLLEVSILSRLRLAQGSAYATTTLMSYLLVIIGVVATFSTLGVSWDKLQWLVAALSVGLGFGLQAIFSNFVSGLIILFERPVRIGDTITIGELSGIVSRIRIRATTITDFDHKEIIVPNQTFITNQLINWSLSDTVTRVTIKVGVEHGTDVEQVRHILLKAASDNPRVLKEPAPLAFFLEFGENALYHELRLHVRELADRTPVIDEVNRTIDQAFSELGIRIASRRLDVRLRNNKGQEVSLNNDGNESPKPMPD